MGTLRTGIYGFLDLRMGRRRGARLPFSHGGAENCFRPLFGGGRLGYWWMGRAPGRAGGGANSGGRTGGWEEGAGPGMEKRQGVRIPGALFVYAARLV